MTRLTKWLLAAPLLLAIILGCKRNAPLPPLGTLTGKITYNKAPVSGGTITFHGKGADGKGAMSSATLKGDGTYTAVGVPVGDVVVTINTESLNPKSKEKEAGKQEKTFQSLKSEDFIRSKTKQGPAPKAAAEAEQKYVKIPEKYRSEKTSPLSFKVGEGSQKKDFELQD